MLLLVDAGNTRVKWALVDAAVPGAPAVMPNWQASGSVAHAELAQLHDDWRAWPVRRALISNVAGAAVAEALQRALPARAAIDWFASTAERAGVRNGYRNPAQLGCDRFASAIGAHALAPDTALIVATCGTATTIDALSAEGKFIGGMILPGLGLMASALARNTAQLPQVAQDLRIESPFADHTDAAIVSGCLAAQAGAIERAVAAQARHGTVRCLLSGGAASLIAPHVRLAQGCERIDNLVLLPPDPAGGVSATAASACIEIGNFDAAEAARFEQGLAGLTLAGKAARGTVIEPVRHMVLIASQGSRDAAERKTAELRRLGITDFFIMPEGEQRWGISLGIFRTEEAARAHLATLTQKGVHSARLGRFGKPEVRTAFQLRALDANANAGVLKLLAEFPKQDLRGCDANFKPAGTP